MNPFKIILAFIIFAIAFTACGTPQNTAIKEVNSPEYCLEPSVFSDGRMMVNNGKENEEKRYGFIDSDGNLSIPFDFVYCWPFQEERAQVFGVDGKNKAFFYIDKSGNKVISQVNGEELYTGGSFYDGYATVQTKDTNQCYVIDAEGRAILSPGEKNYYYDNLGGGLFQRYASKSFLSPQDVVLNDGSVQWTGNCMIIGLNDSINDYYYDEFTQTYGIFSREDFKPLTPEIYKEVTHFQDDVAVVVTTDGAVQLIDSSNKLISNLSEQYENIDTNLLNSVADGVTALNFTDGSGAALIGKDGKLIAKTRYEQILTYFDQIAVCKENNKYGYVDALGSPLLEPSYDYATNADNGIAFVSKDGKIFRVSF